MWANRYATPLSAEGEVALEACAAAAGGALNPATATTVMRATCANQPDNWALRIDLLPSDAVHKKSTDRPDATAGPARSKRLPGCYHGARAHCDIGGGDRWS